MGQSQAWLIEAMVKILGGYDTHANQKQPSDTAKSGRSDIPDLEA